MAQILPIQFQEHLQVSIGHPVGRRSADRRRLRPSSHRDTCIICGYGRRPPSTSKAPLFRSFSAMFVPEMKTFVPFRRFERRGDGEGGDRSMSSAVEGDNGRPLMSSLD